MLSTDLRVLINDPTAEGVELKERQIEALLDCVEENQCGTLNYGEFVKLVGVLTIFSSEEKSNFSFH